MDNSKQARKLIQASLSGDVSRIEALLSKKVDVNCKNAHDQFPLLVASQHGHKEAVQLLIKGGARVDLESRNKVTPLSLASECGHHETVEILVENGAHIDHKVSDDRTPLMLASENGHEETVRVLLSKNANVNLCACEGQTALTFALRNKYAEVAKLLLPHVADVDIRDSSGLTPLMIASFHQCHVNVAELLLVRRARVNLRTPNGSTPLMLASQTGIAEMAKVLLKHGADVDLQGDDGRSALIIASKQGHKDFVEVLLSHNAEVDLCLHSTGETALIVASENGHVEIVKLLLCDDWEQSLQEDRTGKDEDIKASETASDESIGCVEVAENQDEVPKQSIRSRSAKVNVVDNVGRTALSIASSRGDLKIVETLVRHGADVNRSKGENSALSRAVSSQNVEVVGLLLKNNAIVLYTDLVQASKLGCLEIVKLLVPHCASIDPDFPKRHANLFTAGFKQSNAPPSPLWWAIKLGHTHIVHLLLENGASVDNAVRTGGNEPALVLATVQENVEIVEALLSKGANVDVTCGRHQQVTPLMLAIVAGHKKLVRLFAKHGADICLQYSMTAHFTCMDLAKAVGNQKIVSILKEEGSQCESTAAIASQVHDLDFLGHFHKKPRSYTGLLQLVKREYNAVSLTLYVNLQSRIVKQRLYDLFPEKKVESEDDQNEPADDQPQLPMYRPPTINEAYKMLLPVAAKWKNIGVLLNIEYGGKLQNIEADKKASLDALLEMIDEWLKRVDPLPTWNELVEAVEPFNPTVAKKIQEKHCT